MQDAATRMKGMINGLLAYSRVATKAQPFKAVDMNEVAAEVLSDLEVRVQQESGFVEVEALPVIEADEVQMRQLMQNLVTNALKFHQPETPPLVKVSSREVSPEVVEIAIQDNGIGFDEKFLRLIFQPFQRLIGRSEYEGSGIGLAVCRKIVERHHGTITARSIPGEGSTFIIQMPRKQPA
jgi:light-regulated signal transduction histidine kinase (bacteriophytochrome)